MAEKEKEAEEKKVEEFDLEDWLADGIKGLRHTLKGKAKRRQVLPEQFKEHTRAARKEMLLAVRSLLDAAIEEEAEEEPEATKKPTKIEVK
jgi:hypothetical protein